MKPGKMDKVAAVARIDEQVSARVFSASQCSREQKNAQLEQLLQFRADYESTLEQKCAEGIAVDQFQDYRLFLDRLNQAIDLQRREVQASEEHMATVREQWISATQRKSALEHLVDEQHRERVRAHDKAVQKESDERAMRRGAVDKEP